MPELPTREELAEVIANCTCACQGDWQVDHQIACPNAFVAADAVLHRLMRDADTERETLWSRKQVPVPQVPGERAWGCEMTATERQRLSVTFTGEWEPADPTHPTGDGQ